MRQQTNTYSSLLSLRQCAIENKYSLSPLLYSDYGLTHGTMKTGKYILDIRKNMLIYQ